MENKEAAAAGLSDAAKQARREYHTKWQREHPEKEKEYLRRYWEKKGAEILEREQARTDTN